MAAAMEAQAPTWFDAPSPFGVLRLCVRGPSAAGHAAAAALALQQAAPLLDAFDDWSLLDADWRWLDVPAEAPAPGTHVGADWQPVADAPLAARLELPWPLLRHLPPPEALAGVLRWPALPATAVVARLELDGDELAALEPGGAVLLPESMRPGWLGLLRAADEPAGTGVAVALHPQSARLAPTVLERSSAAPPLPADPARPIACEVRLASVAAIGVERLAGWAPGALGELGPCASLWRNAGPHGAASLLASGHLLPWGDGWAMALETVGDTDSRESPTPAQKL